MKLLVSKIRILILLNIFFLNSSAQQVQLLAIPNITSSEIQAQSVVLASSINRDWWLKAGIYTAAVTAAGFLIYNKREALKTWWQKDSRAAVEFNAKQDHEKVATMWHSYTANQAAINQQDTASKTFSAQLKNGAIGTVGLAVAGAIAEPVISPVINKTIKPAFKFMNVRDLDYYLYRTNFHDQLTSLRDFVQEFGDYQIDQNVVIDLKPEIRLKLVNIRAAMVTVLGYIEYVQNDLATGISANQADKIKQKLAILRGIAVKIQTDCNQILVLVQAALGNLKSQADQETLGNRLFKLHVSLTKQFKEFAAQV